MMHATATANSQTTKRPGNVSDTQYSEYLSRFAARFRVTAAERPIFTTDASDLWELYLSSFPARERQYHNCNSCRRFIERFGGLVIFDDSGTQRSAFWNVNDASPVEERAVMRLAIKAASSKVNGVFLAADPTWGVPVTGDWRHLSVTAPTIRWPSLTLTADQAMAEKKQDFLTVVRALEEFTVAHLETAVQLLKGEALYRNEKVLGPAEWLLELRREWGAVKGRERSNVVWRAVATAPAGFCHPRGSMIGTLLDDIKQGLSGTEIAWRFAAKMNPTKYQRPQAAPAAGAIAQAEKLVEKLGIERSLHRRFARLDEIDKLWTPRPEKPETKGGVFGHLKAKATELLGPTMQMNAGSITWEKFARTVLPTAERIDVYIPNQANFCGITTAEHADAPPILQWDGYLPRNPFANYVYQGGSPASNWSLSHFTWKPVAAITLKPHQWFGGKFDHHGSGVVLVITDAKDKSVERCGNALFPETLRAELHGVRSVVEAYSKKATLGGTDKASANGLLIEGKSGARVRVTVARVVTEYTIDRLD